MLVNPAPQLADTTLRDGEQSPGAVLTPRDKLQMAEWLCDLGIPEIEAAIPGMHESEQEAVRLLKSEKFPMRILTWARAAQEDLIACEQCGADSVHISFPVSMTLLQAFGKSESWLWNSLESILNFAVNTFPFVSVGAQDASRASTSLLASFSKQAKELGAQRVRIADTVGIWMPWQTQSVFSALSQAIPNMPFEFHGHNDIGLAVANSLAAWQGGASSLSVTIAGIGERSGNAALEQCAVALRQAGTAPKGLKFNRLYSHARAVHRFFGDSLPKQAPVLGENAYRHESGLHTRGLEQNRDSYHGISPDSVGGPEETLVYGKKSGRASLRQFFRSQKMQMPENDELGLLVSKVKEQANNLGRGLNETELKQLILAETY